MPYLVLAAGAIIFGLYTGSKTAGALTATKEKSDKVLQVAGALGLVYVGYSVYTGRIRVPFTGAK